MSASGGTSDTLLGDHVRRLLRQVLGQPDVPPAAAASLPSSLQRRSNGLREFWKGIEGLPEQVILDLGSASQCNLSFITGRGCKLYAEDLFRLALRAPVARNGPPPLPEAASFFRENLTYAEGQFTGILCWDVLDFLPEHLLKPFVENLYSFLKPGGNLLAFFHTGSPGQDAPVCQYRIHTADTLEVTGREAGKLRRHFNNRAIENLFRNFSSLKFYLSRDNLREVVIVR
ncbi:MAG: methyltransferase domain-containing protein [Terriglobia bacterium]